MGFTVVMAQGKNAHKTLAAQGELETDEQRDQERQREKGREREETEESREVHRVKIAGGGKRKCPQSALREAGRE